MNRKPKPAIATLPAFEYALKMETRIANIEAQLPGLAPKEEVADMRADLKETVGRLETKFERLCTSNERSISEIKEVVGKMHLDNERFRSEVKDIAAQMQINNANFQASMEKRWGEVENRLSSQTKWVLTSVLGGVAAMMSIMMIVLAFTLPKISGSSDAPTPIIIQMPAQVAPVTTTPPTH